MDLFDLIVNYPRATLLIVVIALNWVAAAILYHACLLHPRGVALRERSRAAFVLALALTLSFPLLLNVQFDFPWLDRNLLVWAGYGVTLIAGIPAVAWLVMYLTGSWDDD